MGDQNKGGNTGNQEWEREMARIRDMKEGGRKATKDRETEEEKKRMKGQREEKSMRNTKR